MFYKRLCNQWENEVEERIADLERQQGARSPSSRSAAPLARDAPLPDPGGARWGDVRAVTESKGENLVDAMRAISARMTSCAASSGGLEPAAPDSSAATSFPEMDAPGSGSSPIGTSCCAR